MRRLSGMTLRRSEARSGVDAWISCLRASRARMSARQEGERVLMGSGVDFSSMCFESPMIAVLDCSSWRTCQGSFLPSPRLFSTEFELQGMSLRFGAMSGRLLPWEGVWPKAGGIRSGCLYARADWVPPTNGSGGSAWPTVRTCSGKRSSAANRTELVEMWSTARVADSVGADYQRDRGMVGSERAALGGQAKQWRSPGAQDGAHGGPNSRDSGSGLHLSSEAVRWATPTDHDGRRPGLDVASTQGANLSRDVANWPTPGAGDQDWRVSTQAAAKRRMEGGRQVSLEVCCVAWPSPAARDHKHPNGPDHLERGGRQHMGQLANVVEHRFSSPQGRETAGGERLSEGGRTLNPRFVEWLMGWPIGWTDCDSRAMGLSLYRSRLRSEFLRFVRGESISRGLGND